MRRIGAMSRLKEFKFRWMDAWFRINRGYDSELECLENGEASIHVLVNMEPFEINLTGIEDTFIKDLEDIGINEWDKKYYVLHDYFDGYMWSLSIAYDFRKICAQGANGYPAPFPRFLELLHDKYHLPKSKTESVINLERFIKDTQIEEMNDPENTSFY